MTRTKANPVATRTTDVRRMAQWQILTALMLLGTAYVVAYAGITAKEIIENVQEKYDDMEDAVVVFTQSVRFKVSRLEQQTSGTLYFKKKNKYRIETEQRVLVTDGKTSWSYSPQNKQLVVNTYKEDARSLSPENMLLQYPRDYFSALVGEEKSLGESCYVLKLTPKEGNPAARTMKIWVNKNWIIRKIEATESGGTVTTYTIKDVAIDKGIPDTRFEFKAPSGTDIIDLR